MKICKSFSRKQVFKTTVVLILVILCALYINFQDDVYDNTILRYKLNIKNRNKLIKVKEVSTREELNVCIKKRTLLPFDQSKIKQTNPKSHNFGLVLNRKLHPLKDYVNSSFVQPYFDWKMFFPELVKSMEQFELYNVQKSSKYFTSLKSTVTLDKSNIYQKGKEIFATIQARTENGVNKHFGGDVFYARIVPENALETYPKDGIPCEITDNLDGTYRLKAPLLLTGRLKLQVKLLISVEGIQYAATSSSDRSYKTSTYRAKLDSGENIRCNWDMFMYNKDALCDYSNPRTKEPWFCTTPSTNICHPIVAIAPFATGLNELYVLPDLFSKFLCFGEISGSSVSFNVENAQTPPAILSSLKPCKKADTFKSSKVTGYFEDRVWNSLICKNRIHSLEQMKSCFKNKSVYFLGDSTMRQFFDYLRVWLELKHTLPADEDQYWPSRVAYDDENNIYVYFRGHGLPLLNVAMPYYTFEKAQYISDVLGGLQGGKNVVVVITVGLHIFSYDPSLLINRFITIRKEIELLNERSPGTTIIIRGQNLISAPISWYLLRQDTIVREIMKGCDNVYFLDLWGMTNVTPLGDYHPVGELLEQQTFLLSDFICDL